MTKAYMILDLQYGSTGKGLLAGFLAKQEKPDVVVTAWGPNAGHTYIDSDGREFIHRMLANGIVSPKLTTVLIGPGSVIDLDILYEELFQARDLMKGKRLVIHPQAVIVTAKHREEEARNVKIGSTMKGTGAAVIQRILRDPDDLNTAGDKISPNWIDSAHMIGIDVAVCSIQYMMSMMQAQKIQIEGAQGYSLSMYHGFYPYTTSRDVTPAQVMADCAIPFAIKPEVYGTLRTYPIRVSNRYDEDGKMIGTSGPCHADQIELKWSEIHNEDEGGIGGGGGIQPELTTVTKLPRRIFSFSLIQLRDALYQCGPTKLFLNFANYMSKEEVEGLIGLIEVHIDAMTDVDLDLEGCKVEWVGVGPTHDDVLTKQHYLTGVPF